MSGKRSKWSRMARPRPNSVEAKPLSPRSPAPCRKKINGHELMDVTKMLAELKAEREPVEQAILVLERIASGRGTRRGPPTCMDVAREAPGKASGK